MAERVSIRRVWPVSRDVLKVIQKGRKVETEGGIDGAMTVQVNDPIDAMFYFSDGSHCLYEYISRVLEAEISEPLLDSPTSNPTSTPTSEQSASPILSLESPVIRKRKSMATPKVTKPPKQKNLAKVIRRVPVATPSTSTSTIHASTTASAPAHSTAPTTDNSTVSATGYITTEKADTLIALLISNKSAFTDLQNTMTLLNENISKAVFALSNLHEKTSSENELHKVQQNVPSPIPTDNQSVSRRPTMAANSLDISLNTWLNSSTAGGYLQQVTNFQADNNNNNNNDSTTFHTLNTSELFSTLDDAGLTCNVSISNTAATPALTTAHATAPTTAYTTAPTTSCSTALYATPASMPAFPPAYSSSSTLAFPPGNSTASTPVSTPAFSTSDSTSTNVATGTSSIAISHLPDDPYDRFWQHVKGNSSSRVNFAWNIAKVVFSREELVGHNSRGYKKPQLDIMKMSNVKKITLAWYPVGNQENEIKVWRECEKCVDSCLRGPNYKM